MPITVIKLSRWRQLILLLSWSRILPHLQACCRFMEAGRRHKTAGSVIKDFTSSTVSNMSICICSLNSHMNDNWEPRYVLRIIVEDQWAWGIHSFYSSSKQACSLSRKRCCLISQGCVLKTQLWKMGQVKSSQDFSFIRYT